jgi:hypothetical protein
MGLLLGWVSVGRVRLCGVLCGMHVRVCMLCVSGVAFGSPECCFVCVEWPTQS